MYNNMKANPAAAKGMAKASANKAMAAKKAAPQAAKGMDKAFKKGGMVKKGKK